MSWVEEAITLRGLKGRENLSATISTVRATLTLERAALSTVSDTISRVREALTLVTAIFSYSCSMPEDHASRWERYRRPILLATVLVLAATAVSRLAIQAPRLIAGGPEVFGARSGKGNTLCNRAEG